ncbi:acetoacetate decarboxylase family protein [Streptomyces collinus]|uniref:acetoacetate decarboxylase family protein n=1 Tax=Streptomyces collinus TaxID=42684 RepID=UPI0029431D3C|nr:acetoacetate decarboxylase family protein [Streptomyces collinus]
MRADDHAPGRTTEDGQEAEELLRRCARELMVVADGLREVSARTGAALFAPSLAASVRERPRTGLAARWALLRALTGGRGLGGPVGVPPHGTGRLLGAARAVLGRESLAALVAVGSLRLRMAAVLAGHPGYGRDPGMRRLTDAVAAHKDAEAVRALRALFRDPGAQRALSGLAPLMTQLLAVRALLDEEPRPDRTRRKASGGRVPATHPARATGAVPAAEAARPTNAVPAADAVPAAGAAASIGVAPTIGAAPSTDATDGTTAAPPTSAVAASGATPSTGAFHPGRRDPGDGAAEAVGLTVQERQIVATEGSFLGYLRNIEVLSGDGRILVQNVRGPDGVVRYVVQVPGTAPGRPRQALPQDFAEAWRALFRTDSPHTRSILLALRDHGIPRGAELALVGHGEGGVALLNLARDPEFCRDHRVTHVIAVGSPPGDRRVADPRTRIVRVTNRHDLVAVPDGRGAAPQPPPAAAPQQPAAADPDPHSHRHPQQRPAPKPYAHPRPDPDANPYEAEYAGPTREFPLCHLIREYIEHLRTVVPGVREDVDEALGAYRGPVVRTQAYRLGNRAHPPEGHPFLTLPTASVPTTTGPVDVPVRYYDSSAAHLCFPVDAGAAHALLPENTWMRPSRLGRRALAVLSLYEHRCSTIGPHAEIALSVLVDDLWRPRPYDIAADLLRRADLRRTGRCVLSLAVSSEEARVVAREVWGRPAVRTPADAELMTRHLRFTAAEMGLTVEGRLGPGVRCPEPDWVLYGRRGESTVRSVARAHGRSRLHLATRVRLRLNTAAAEPLAGQLRRLHIDTARPLFVLACPQFMVHRGAGVVLPR